MAEIIFLYQSKETLIQCLKDELMKNICQKFANKTTINIKDIFFIYNGNKINENLTFAQLANSEDKTRNKMNILVYDLKEQKNQNIVKSPEVICFECKELSFLKIIDYQIYLSNCKNGHEKN